MPIKDTNGKRKFKRMLSFHFVDKQKLLAIVFRAIQPCFVHGGLERLAFFEPTKAARFQKSLEVYPLLYDQRKVRC